MTVPTGGNSPNSLSSMDDYSDYKVSDLRVLVAMAVRSGGECNYGYVNSLKKITKYEYLENVIFFQSSKLL